MLPLGMVITWAAYAVGSWGYVLVRGWNITLREWASPLHPYQFTPGQDPQPVPLGKTWPTGTGKPIKNNNSPDQGSPANPGALG